MAHDLLDRPRSLTQQCGADGQHLCAQGVWCTDLQGLQSPWTQCLVKAAWRRRSCIQSLATAKCRTPADPSGCAAACIVQLTSLAGPCSRPRTAPPTPSAAPFHHTSKLSFSCRQRHVLPRDRRVTRHPCQDRVRVGVKCRHQTQRGAPTRDWASRSAQTGWLTRPQSSWAATATSTQSSAKNR